MIYFAALQQCKGKLLLHFHGNNEHFCIADSDIHVKNKQRTYWSVSMATMDKRMRHNVTPYVLYIVCLAFVREDNYD